MKFGPKSLRFVFPVLTVFRRCLVFVGGDNTIHLQETAAVIEGDLVRFQLPVLDMLMRRAFAERTMITIPYSRIVRFSRARYIAVKLLWWLLAAAAYASMFLATWDRLDPGGSAYVLALMALGFLLVGFLVHLLFRPRQALTFRRADGKRCLVCFRFGSGKRSRQFTELLKANRDAARLLSAPAAAPTAALETAR